MLHTWSLAVEEHFYIIWPAIVLFCSYRCFVKNWLLISLTILILSMILYCYFFEANTVIYLVGKSTNTRFISLVIGAFIAYKEDYFRSLRNNSIYPFLTAICYTIVFIISYNGALINTFLPWIIPSLIFATLGSTFLFIYALNLEGKNNYANRIFTNKVIVYMGLISYGLYLYHYPIFYKLGFFTDNQISGFYQIVLALTLSIGISALSYRYIEKPLLRYKDRITR
jgi:peptidoglycan/LPS O-acetylase OafA/YrhL